MLAVQICVCWFTTVVCEINDDGRKELFLCVIICVFIPIAVRYVNDAIRLRSKADQQQLT